MNAIEENDTFVLSESVEATVIGEHRVVMLPIGTLVSVVLVLGDLSSPSAYEVEAFLAKDDIYALATIETHDAERIFKKPGNLG